MSTAPTEPLGSSIQTRMKIARTIKADPNADVTQLREQYRLERRAERIAEAVAAAPPLPDEVRAYIAELLKGTGA